MLLNCRFYENEYPKLDDVVMVQVDSINNMGINVNLLEYNNLSGYISVNALSRKRIKSLAKIVKVGKIMPLIVIRIDEDKGYIDLSKRDVTNEDDELCRAKYQKAKHLLGLVKSALIATRNKDNSWNDISLEECCRQTIWSIYKLTNNNPDEVLNKILADKHFFDNLDDGIFKQELINTFNKKYKNENPLIEAHVQIICYSDNAVEDIKSSIDLCFKFKNEESELQVTIITPPIFKFYLKSLNDSNNALQEMNTILDNLKKEIGKRSGIMKIVKEPHVINE